MKSSRLSPVTVVIIMVGAVGLFALSVLLEAMDDSPTAGERHGPGAYSTSAIGCSGLAEMVRRLDWPILKAVEEITEAAGAHGTIVVTEPTAPSSPPLQEGNVVDTAQRVLLVLPKWTGDPKPGRSRWIEKARLYPAVIPQAVARQAAGEVTVMRTVDKVEWQINPYPWTPAFSHGVQLMLSDRLRPLLACEEGILLGEADAGDRRVWLLSDPDLLNNHGIFQGDNAQLAYAVLRELSQWRQTEERPLLVFDETIHGYQASRATPLRLIIEFPYVVVTLTALLAGLVAILAGIGRFGPAERTEKPYDFGKAMLIDNSARLLDLSGHSSLVVKRYVRMVIVSTAQALHAPPALPFDRLAAWLDTIGSQRGVTVSCADIVQRCEKDDGSGQPEPGQAPAEAVYRWRREMLDGR